MTTSDENTPQPTEETIERLTENMEKVEALSKRLVEVMAGKKSHTPALDGPNQELFAKAATGDCAEATESPAKVLEHQL